MCVGLASAGVGVVSIAAFRESNGAMMGKKNVIVFGGVFFIRKMRWKCLGGFIGIFVDNGCI